jgi:hypothetical protein
VDVGRREAGIELEHALERALGFRFVDQVHVSDVDVRVA